jgi:hypothetical protein
MSLHNHPKMGLNLPPIAQSLFRTGHNFGDCQTSDPMCAPPPALQTNPVTYPPCNTPSSITVTIPISTPVSALNTLLQMASYN